VVIAAPPQARLLCVRAPGLPFEAGLGLLAVSLPHAAWLAPRRGVRLSGGPDSSGTGVDR